MGAIYKFTTGKEKTSFSCVFPIEQTFIKNTFESANLQAVNQPAVMQEQE
jgi:hypothetical protein